MPRLIYSGVLTLAWLVVATQYDHLGMGALLPAAAVVAAWFAAYNFRAGYLAYSITSVVLIGLLGLMAVFMLAPGALAFMGGKGSLLLAVVGVGLGMILLAGLHAVGLVVLKTRPGVCA